MTKGKGKNPGAGGLDKHIKRKEHKERSQPASRAHLGQLEKHKDHALRAKKRRVKVQRLNEIKRAAAQRNPDEYNIGMTKAVMDVATGRMRRRPQRSTPQERSSELRKTIDANLRNVQYLEFKANADLNRAKELLDEDASAAITASTPANRHIVFVESEEEFKRFNPLKHFDVTPEMLRQHPAVRGTISVLKNTVLPDEVLLAGHQMKSTAQLRKERRAVQEQLRRSGAADSESRAAVIERLKAKREMRQYRFADLVSEASAAQSAASAAASGDGEEGEDAKDEVTRLLEQRRMREQQEALLAARRMREITQRVERSKNLADLASVVRRQNKGIKSQMEQRKNSRFKPNAVRRSR